MSYLWCRKAELIQIGDQKHAILLKSGYGNLGYSNTSATIIAETENSLDVNLRFGRERDDYRGLGMHLPIYCGIIRRKLTGFYNLEGRKRDIPRR